MRITITDSSLLRLMQFSSASLPVGAYAFSQGLESAVEFSWIKNQDETFEWLHTQISQSLVYVDLPILFRMMSAIQGEDNKAIAYWNDYLIACRETQELVLSDIAPGEALQRLLKNLGENPVTTNVANPTFILGFAYAATMWNISNEAAALGYLWSWLENQVAAATKLVPLGQTQAQRLLSELQTDLAAHIEHAQKIEDEDIGSSLPALAIVSALHETQYSRLFRS
ncbi:MAG: urease accessory protein UreF [Agarilytica sp.]